MVAHDQTSSLVPFHSSRSSLSFVPVLPSLQSCCSGAPERHDRRGPAGKNPRNLGIITISDIGERYFEFYKRLPQRKTSRVMGGE
jgi:hypothetical protein